MLELSFLYRHYLFTAIHIFTTLHIWFSIASNTVNHCKPWKLSAEEPKEKTTPNEIHEKQHQLYYNTCTSWLVIQDYNKNLRNITIYFQNLDSKAYWVYIKNFKSTFWELSPMWNEISIEFIGKKSVRCGQMVKSMYFSSFSSLHSIFHGNTWILNTKKRI